MPARLRVGPNQPADGCRPPGLTTTTARVGGHIQMSTRNCKSAAIVSVAAEQHMPYRVAPPCRAVWNDATLCGTAIGIKEPAPSPTRYPTNTSSSMLA
jgi:hypothetical protein